MKQQESIVKMLIAAIAPVLYVLIFENEPGFPLTSQLFTELVLWLAGLFVTRSAARSWILHKKQLQLRAERPSRIPTPRLGHVSFLLGTIFTGWFALIKSITVLFSAP